MKKISALAIAGVFTASLAATAFAEMAEVKAGGEIRVRYLNTNNYDFNEDAGDSNNQISQRSRVNVDATVNETTKAYISLQDTRTWGSETGTTTTGDDVQAVDVSQAYIQLDKLAGQPLSLKIGRQALAYGDQRLIGGLEWSDNARRFDAIKLMYNIDAVGVDLFTAKLDENGNGTLGTTGGDDGTFNGLYVTVKAIPMNVLDLYLLQKKEIDASGEDMLTYGLRIAGGAMNIDWTAEGAMQSGDDSEVAGSTVDQSANMYTLKLGYTIPEVASLRIGAEYDFASGDEDATDDENNDFDNLYPTNHDKYGVSDIKIGGVEVGLSDLAAWSVNLSAKPAAGLKLVAEYWDFSTDEEYAAGEDHIGSEFNIQAWYALSSNLDLHAYWARFMPDDNIGDDDADNVTVQLTAKF
ncbi:MAG: alginate export family protein [Deltaproteobacteria bacterium]|nr:alginate export family protein [Deltaproteobacteria bacterium]